MKRVTITALTAMLAWSVGAPFASAQFGTLGQAPIRPRPTVSPYIDLGVGGAMGYYGLVKPQVDATRNIQDLQNVVTRLNPDGSLAGQLDLLNPLNAMVSGLQTGHNSTYFNYSHYYPNSPPMGSGSGTGNNAQGLGSGMGGYNPGMNGYGGGGFGAGGFGVGGFGGGGFGGFGAFGGGRGTFFGSTLNQGFR